MKYGAVVFDLDGTLTDSQEGITRSVAYALEKWARRRFRRMYCANSWGRR